MKQELKLCRMCGIQEVWSKKEQLIYETLCPQCEEDVNRRKSK